jgi:Ras-related GTP-binding protein A/B
MFQDVEVLIYVFDAESYDHGVDYQLFEDILSRLERSSPDARVFVLIHKMDLIEISTRGKLL